MTIAAYTPQERAQQELEWRKIIDDPIHFIFTYCKVPPKSGGVAKTMERREYQVGVVNAYEEHTHNVVLKARQTGITVVTFGYALHKLLTVPNFKVFYQSTSFTESSRQMDTLRQMYETLPEWIRWKVVKGGQSRKAKLKDNENVIQWDNGSEIRAMQTGRRAGHGAAGGLVILDEFAYNPEAPGTWKAMLPVIAQGGRLIVISTAVGIGNTFHNIWNEAENKTNGIHPIFLPASILYDSDFLEAERLRYSGSRVDYLQSYPETPAEAFQSSSRSPFNKDRLNAMLREISEHRIEPEVGNLELARHTIDGEDAVYKWEPSRTGNYEVWKHPVRGRRSHNYIVGADVAMGLSEDEGDWSVAVVLDASTQEVVAMFRARIPQDEYAAFLIPLATYYNNAWLIVERNAVASIVIERLTPSYQYLYRQTVLGETYGAKNRVEVGFWTHAHTKKRLIGNLKAAISSATHPLRIYSRLILNELLTFEEDQRGRLRASGSNYDDSVIALALTIEAQASIEFGTDDYQASATQIPWYAY